MGTASATDELTLESRIADAALRCVGRWGIAKTTLDDVAREAGCGRATIYRTFAGGKASVLQAVVLREVANAEATIDAAVRDATTLDDLLVAGTLAASRLIREHAAFQFLLAHEPDVVLPFMSFERLDLFLRHAAGFAAPYLAPFLPPGDVSRAAEWVVRVVLSYALNPSDHIDPTDAAGARRLVTTYLLPAVQPLHRS